VCICVCVCLCLCLRLCVGVCLSRWILSWLNVIHDWCVCWFPAAPEQAARPARPVLTESFTDTTKADPAEAGPTEAHPGQSCFHQSTAMDYEPVLLDSDILLNVL
jgi:hypothetical protein